jgi:hypothetical protein
MERFSQKTNGRLSGQRHFLVKEMSSPFSRKQLKLEQILLSLPTRIPICVRPCLREKFHPFLGRLWLVLRVRDER